ncbi:hypothetical protein Ddc_13352 [Ditylenchus destructor]|nr:hypothetical protein Ddc_13352 [Ditylenchus destructor]
MRKSAGKAGASTGAGRLARSATTLADWLLVFGEWERQTNNQSFGQPAAVGSRIEKNLRNWENILQGNPMRTRIMHEEVENMRILDATLPLARLL